MGRAIFPIVLPIGVIIVVGLLISGIGSLLLAVSAASGEHLAVALALFLAMAVLLISWYLASRPTDSSHLAP